MTSDRVRTESDAAQSAFGRRGRWFESAHTDHQ